MRPSLLAWCLRWQSTDIKLDINFAIFNRTLGETLQQVKAATLMESKIHQEFAAKVNKANVCRGLTCSQRCLLPD